MYTAYYTVISVAKVGLRDLKHFMEVKPIRFFDRSIDIKGTDQQISDFCIIATIC